MKKDVINAGILWVSIISTDIASWNSHSNNRDVSGNNRDDDFWLDQIYGFRDIKWKNLWKENFGCANSVIQTAGNGYIAANNSDSKN